MRMLVHGTGSIGMRHLRVLRGLGVDVVALPVRADRVDCEELRDWRTVRSYEEAKELGISAVIVATDTGRHLADVESAVEVGCHVLVEKPVAPTIEGVSRVARLASAKGRTVFVALNMRFSDSLLAFRRRLPEIGRVDSVRIECQSFLPDWRPGTDYRRSYSARASDGGVLRDLVHELDYACWLFGKPSHLFAATTTGRLGIEAEEEADILWRAGDATVSVRLDYVTRVPRRFMRAHGENGDLEWDGIGARIALRLRDGTREEAEHPMDRDTMMAEQAKAFIAAIDGAGSRDLASLEDGAYAVSLCDAARRSAETERVEAIVPWDVRGNE